MNTQTPTVDDQHADAQLHAASALVGQDLTAVNTEISRRLDSKIALIRTLGAYLIRGGGKRIRPMILLLCAAAGNYRGAAHITLAAVIEFIHTATLLHDDVVDGSRMRRGRASANEVWGNEASVLVGDFLYSRAFEMMVEIDNTEVMAILAATTNAIAEGEVMQLINAGAPDTTEQAYFDTIRRKTARLFESAAQLGAVISAQPPPARRAFAEFGLRLGTAFQLTDDILDYTAAASATGKNAGDDLAEGKPTLPLIYALRHGDRQQRDSVRRALENGERERIDEILAIVQATGALAYSVEMANREAAAAAAALSGVADSKYKTALLGLAEFSVRRGH